jgi:uncharacterized protein YcnI
MRAEQFRRFVVTGLLCTAAMVAVPPVAFAHVSVTPDSTAPGEPATIAFRVPNESDDASTVRLEVAFPADTPLAVAVPRTVPGWTVKVTRQALDEPVDTGHGLVEEAISSIVWEGGQIQPDTYQEFPVYVPAMPHESGALTFKALQTYSSGEVVRWIDVAAEGQPEPEHPAPTVRVAPPPAPATTSTSDTTGRILGGAGLAAGLAAFALAASGKRRRAPLEVGAAPKREKARL